jgi:hypothetical protein
MHIQQTVLADSVPFGIFGSTNTEYPLDAMADTGLADKVTFYVQSTLDQAVTVQVVASGENSPRNLQELNDVGASISVADGSSTPQKAALSVNLEDNWHPWYGLTVETGGSAPSSGVFRARAVVRLITGHEAGAENPALQQMAQFLAEMRDTQQSMNQAIQELLGRPVPQPGHRHGLIGSLFQERR